LEWHEISGKRRVAFKKITALQWSPVSGNSLRFAGQSLREEINRLSDFGLIPFLIFSFAFWIVCAVEWTQKFAGEAPDPRFWTVLSLIVTIYGGFQVFRLRPAFRNFRLGESGEQRVAELLDRLRSKGFAAFHDLPNSGLNVDHVVVGPSGIYAIETKTRSGSGTINYASERELIFGGRINDGRPLRQAQNSARALHRQLKEHLDQACWVKPVLVFCGNWRVQRQPGDFSVEVMTTEQLENYFDRQQPELTSKEISDICSELERSARIDQPNPGTLEVQQ
jgi:hypothetical protein